VIKETVLQAEDIEEAKTHIETLRAEIKQVVLQMNNPKVNQLIPTQREYETLIQIYTGALKEYFHKFGWKEWYVNN